MIVLGVDPGLTRANPTGLAVVDVDAKQLLYAGIFVSAAKQWYERAPEIGLWIDEKVLLYRPELLGYELMHVDENPQSAFKLAGVGGMLLLESGLRHVPVYPVQPIQAKIALAGDPRASKQMMMDAVRAIFGKSIVKDAADAVGIAMAAEMHWKREQVVRRAEAMIRR